MTALPLAHGQDEPLFAYPFEVYHTIDKDSILYGKTKADLANMRAELVLVFEAVIMATGNR